MDYIVKEKFVINFPDYCLEESYEDLGRSCRRVKSEIDNLASKGLKKYDAIMSVCEKNNISFEILLKTKSSITITTFMDNREWSATTMKGNKYDVSKFLAIELHKLLCDKFNNLIFIENVSNGEL